MSPMIGVIGGNRRARVVQAAGGDSFAYFETLKARGDHIVNYSLRDAAQVEQYREAVSPPGAPISIYYDYANDPDPRKQDACKLHVHDVADLHTGLTQSMGLPIPANYPNNVMVTYDEWMGVEWDYTIAQLPYHKGFPYWYAGSTQVNWLAARKYYNIAHVHEETLPAGGPYITMYAPQGGSNVAGCYFKDPFYRDADAGYPRERLPYGAASGDQRPYNEGIAPRATDVTAAGMEFGIVAERWHRYWWFWERAASEDWEVTFNSAPITVKAYKMSIWCCDTVREPVCISKDVIVSIYPGITDGITQIRWHVSLGDSFAYPPGRPDLIAYIRNVVALSGLSSATFATLREKPVVT